MGGVLYGVVSEKLIYEFGFWFFKVVNGFIELKSLFIVVFDSCVRFIVYDYYV